MDAVQDRQPSPVHQRRALAPQRLGGERRGVQAQVDGRGVELDELGIEHRRARQRRHRQPLAPERARVGGDRVEPAHAARRQHGRGRRDLDPPFALVREHAPDAARNVLQQRTGADAREDRHMRGGKRGPLNRGQNGAPGSIAAHAHHPRPAVRGLQADAVAVLVTVELRAERGQTGHHLGAEVGQRAGAILQHQARAGRDRIGGVQRRGVPWPDRGRDPALSPGGRGALAHGLGGQYQRGARRGAQGRRQAGQARADD